MSRGFLPYGRQTIEDDDVAAVAAALRADFLTTGPLVERFERAFAEKTGAAHAVACNSGTAALHLAALALDLKPGAAAVVPAMTFLATANVVRMTGAEVVFADVDPATGLLSPETLEAASSRIDKSRLTARAAFPVHLNGQVCDLAVLAEVADRRNVQLRRGCVPRARRQQDRSGAIFGCGVFFDPSGQSGYDRRGRRRHNAQRRDGGSDAPIAVAWDES